MRDVDGGNREISWFNGGAAVCVFLVSVTVLQHLSRGTGSASYLLNQFSLAGENNAAAWWSGMLLAVACLLAYDRYATLRQNDPTTARAWILMAAVLLFFSADEVSSIHERMSVLGRMWGITSWGLLIPLGAVVGVILGWAFLLLWLAGGRERRQARWIAVGFSLLGSVAVQEFLEHRIAFQSAAAIAARTAVEEGTELIGMLILIRVFMTGTTGLAGRFAALHELRRPLVLLGLVLLPILAVITAGLTDHHRGRPGDWLAAVAFLAAGLAIGGRLVRGREGNPAALMLACLCVLASITAVGIAPTALTSFGPMEVSIRMMVLGILSLLICATWVGLSDGGDWMDRRGIAALGILAVLSLPLGTSPLMRNMLMPLMGLLAFWVHTGMPSRVGAQSQMAIPNRFVIIEPPRAGRAAPPRVRF